MTLLELYNLKLHEYKTKNYFQFESSFYHIINKFIFLALDLVFLTYLQNN